jgi:two-component system response regulator YesN
MYLLKDCIAIKGNNDKNLNSIIKCAENYSISTGIPLIVINREGDTIFSTKNMNCSFCYKVRAIMEKRLDCKHSHLYGSYQAERFGGKYVFFCQLGLTHWVSPITLDDFNGRALIAGPALMVRPDDFLFEDILKKHIKYEQISELKSEIDKIPVIDPDKVDHLSSLLFIVAAYISGEGIDYLTESREILEQQSDLSSYIHYIKTMGGGAESDFSYPIEKERELVSLISTGNKYKESLE